LNYVTIELDNLVDCDCYDCQPQCNFEGWRAAMAYVPMQPWEQPFDLDKGLKSGTIFPSLKMPFEGGARR